MASSVRFSSVLAPAKERMSLHTKENKLWEIHLGVIYDIVTHVCSGFLFNKLWL